MTIIPFWEIKQKKEQEEAEEKTDGLLTLEEQARKNELKKQKLDGARANHNRTVTSAYGLKPNRPLPKKPPGRGGTGGDGGGGSPPPHFA